MKNYYLRLSAHYLPYSNLRTYFKNLDALRAIAALIVVIVHIENVKEQLFIPNIFDQKNRCFPDSILAVMLFFVLSGFLITYFLTIELQETGTISFKKFYWRRILRIFPVYYLVILLSCFILNEEVSPLGTLLSLTFFPNIAMAIKQPWAHSPQIWSIGVEEQFYIIWPFLLYLTPDKNKIKYFLIYCLLHCALVIAVGLIIHNFRIFEDETITRSIHNAILATRYHFLVIGGLLGYMYAKKNRFISYLYKDYIAYPAIILSFVFLLIGRDFLGGTRFLADEFYVILFGITILNLATNAKLKMSIDIPIFNFLGRISYGIYMYHWIILILVIKSLDYTIGDNLFLFNVKVYLLVVSSTILISWLSYIGYEQYFLKLKNKLN